MVCVCILFSFHLSTGCLIFDFRTENEGWFEYWGKEYDANITEWDNRSPEDMANTVALWFGAGACHHNYYMWYVLNFVYIALLYDF